MRLTNKKREYLAKTLAKISEFVVSILIIGYLVAAKLNPKLGLDLIFILWAAITAVIILMVGTVIRPEDGENKGRE